MINNCLSGAYIHKAVRLFCRIRWSLEARKWGIKTAMSSWPAPTKTLVEFQRDPKTRNPYIVVSRLCEILRYKGLPLTFVTDIIKYCRILSITRTLTSDATTHAYSVLLCMSEELNMKVSFTLLLFCMKGIYWSTAVSSHKESIIWKLESIWTICWERVEILVIWDPMTRMWWHCKDIYWSH